MKNSIILLLLLLAVPFYSFAQYESIRTGIMPFYDIDSNNKETVLPVSALTAEFSKYEFIKLVERSQLKDVINEIKISFTGIVDESTAVKTGKIHGLQVMVVGTIRKGRIASRAIHVETGKIIASYSISDISEMIILGRKLASGMEIFLARENLKSMRNDSPVLNLDFWGKRKNDDNIKINKENIIKIGESVVFNFKSNKNGYLTIVDIQPNGDLVVLFPNDFSPKNKIKKDKEYSIPSKDDMFEIIVCEPAGTDTVVAFFTEKKVNWLDRKKLTGEGFWTARENQKYSLTRGFKVTATKLKKSEWESKILEIDVKK